MDDRRGDPLPQGDGEGPLLDRQLAVPSRAPDPVGHGQHQRLGPAEQLEGEGARLGVPGPAIHAVPVVTRINAVLVEDQEALGGGHRPAAPGPIEGDGAQHRLGTGDQRDETRRRDGAGGTAAEQAHGGRLPARSHRTDARSGAGRVLVRG